MTTVQPTPADRAPEFADAASAEDAAYLRGHLAALRMRRNADTRTPLQRGLDLLTGMSGEDLRALATAIDAIGAARLHQQAPAPAGARRTGGGTLLQAMPGGVA